MKLFTILFFGFYALTAQATSATIPGEVLYDCTTADGEFQIVISTTKTRNSYDGQTATIFDDSGALVTQFELITHSGWPPIYDSVDNFYDKATGGFDFHFFQRNGEVTWILSKFAAPKKYHDPTRGPLGNWQNTCK